MISKILRKFAFNERLRDEWVENKAASTPANLKVLDIGAGSCPYRRLFSHCDYASQDFAKLKSDQLRGNQVYEEFDYVCDISEIPVEGNSFDVALCTEVLEHVPEPIRAVTEIGRILKPGGKLLLTAPLGSGLHQDPYHFYGGYTPYWYEKFLTEAGFTEIVVEPNRGSYSHFSQECIRSLTWLAPWKSLKNIIWLPLWLIGLPWCLGLALFAKRLDKLEPHMGFTVGYHVTAVKEQKSA